METNPYIRKLPLYESLVIRTKDGGTSIVKCVKCDGTGIYMYPHSCWTCNGTGEAVFEPMTKRQIKYIRSLFKMAEVSLTNDERQYIVTTMKNHITEVSSVDKYWASALIQFLMAYKR